MTVFKHILNMSTCSCKLGHPQGCCIPWEACVQGKPDCGSNHKKRIISKKKKKKNIEFGWPFGSYEANWGIFKTRSQAMLSRAVLKPHFEYPDSLPLPSPPIILWITKFASNPQVIAIPPSVHQQLFRPVGGHNLLGVAWRPQVPVTLQQNCFLLSTVCNVTSFHLFLNSLLLS